MLDVFLDALKRMIKSRLFPLSFIYIALFGWLIHRLFVLQIVEGPAIAQENNFRETQNREILSTRGNIYDRHGVLLASNILSYSVTMEDSTEIKSNEERNAVIYQMIQIIRDNGDTLYNEFPIVQNSEGELEFTISGAALLRFKKNAYTYVLDDKKQLKKEQAEASAAKVYEFLKNGTGDDYTDMFGISDEYTVEETLDIMSVRYALLCNYPKFLRITVANKVNDKTVACILESSAELPGVEIQQLTQRVYHNSLYFAHMLGYTGQISSEELDLLNADGEYYNSTDVVGKTGLEKEFELQLRGEKGSETVTVNTGNKVIDVVDRKDPVAGNDIYLTIDSELQKSTYHILEKRIAGILLTKIVSDLDYGSKGESASEITIPIYEVYYALINNNILDITALNDKDATELEKQTYDKYNTKLSDVFKQLDSLLSLNNTVTNDKAGDMKEYLDYFYQILKANGVLLEDAIPKEDEQYKSYVNNKLPLSSFLQYAISKNYIDLSKLEVGSDLLISDELYLKLIAYGKNILKADGTFNKKIYRDLVFSYKLSGKEICLLLFDQGVLEYNEEDRAALLNGTISAYNFMRAKIQSLEITPAMLALEPCSGSIVITDVKTGDLLALVTYPSYDNNKLANKVDSAYYNWLFTDKSLPWMNRPMQQRTAPGSTFKMVTSFAALEEGVIGPHDKITDLGIFERIQPAPKCHIYPRSHGSVEMADAIKVSCNYYFYELGFRLSIDSSGKYNEQVGLEKLKKYASLFGLDTTSGVELSEMKPQVSDDDPVRSSIGQGTNAYTPIQLSRYVTTLANRGINYDLTLLDRIVDKDGKVILQNSAKIYKDLTDISPAYWDAVQKGMYNVANAQGGSVNGLYKNLGVTVAGKTGTSQISKVNFNNALFISYAPFENPEISVTTVIPNGVTSGNAAEISRDIYRLYYNLEDPEELMEREASLPENNIAAFSD